VPDNTAVAGIIAIAVLVSMFGSLTSEQSALRSQTSLNQTLECVQFKSEPRLTSGARFRLPIMRGLELRMELNVPIKVGPKEQPDVDYLWIVSPPLQYAPHVYLHAESKTRLPGTGYHSPAGPVRQR